MILSAISTIMILLSTFLTAASIFIHFNCLVVTIDQSSMYPTLVPGDRILVLRRWPAHWLRKGKIVLLKMEHLEPPLAGPNSSPSTLYVKRIVGIAGETFVTTQEGEVLLSHNIQVPTGSEQRLWHIPTSSLLVRGDNRAHSLDSHSWGPIPTTCVQGIMLTRLQRTKSANTFLQTAAQSLPVGEDAPRFEASTLHGEVVNLQTYTKQSLLLVFFMPSHILNTHFFQHDLHVPGIPETGMSTVLVSGATMQYTRIFLAKVHTNLPVLIAPTKTNSMFKDYKISSFPSYCFIDTEGKLSATGRINIKEQEGSSLHNNVHDTKSGVTVSVKERKFIE